MGVTLSIGHRDEARSREKLIEQFDRFVLLADDRIHFRERFGRFRAIESIHVFREHSVARIPSAIAASFSPSHARIFAELE